jgi:hypothetical protein
MKQKLNTESIKIGDTKYVTEKQYKTLQEQLKKKLEYDDKLKKHKIKHELKEKKREEKLKFLEKKSKLTEADRINMNDFKSDDWFLKRVDRLKWYNLIKKHKRKSLRYVLIIVHRQDNTDLAKFFPIENHKVIINKKYYLFNPVHFRYINGQAVLYFFYGNPFAKLISVNDSYIEPTISTEAFTSVMTSKFVEDAVRGEEEKGGKLGALIIIVLVVISLVLNFIVLVQLTQIGKALGG